MQAATVRSSTDTARPTLPAGCALMTQADGCDQTDPAYLQQPPQRQPGRLAQWRGGHFNVAGGRPVLGAVQTIPDRFNYLPNGRTGQHAPYWDQ